MSINAQINADELVFTHNGKTFCVSDDTVEQFKNGETDYMVAYDIETDEEFDAQGQEIDAQDIAHMVALAKQL